MRLRHVRARTAELSTHILADKYLRILTIHCDKIVYIHHKYVVINMCARVYAMFVHKCTMVRVFVRGHIFNAIIKH